jgi:putative sigma-54 modulation protein
MYPTRRRDDECERGTVDVRVKSRHGEATDGFKRAAEEKLGRAARGYDAVDVIEVELSEHQTRRPDQRVRLEVNTAVQGRFVRVVSEGASADEALDDAVDRFSRQLRRLKERLIGGHRKTPDQTTPAEDLDRRYEVVRVKQFIMKPMSVDEAALQMELLGHSFFFFLNASNDKQSVLYRRADGRLGMIEGT